MEKRKQYDNKIILPRTEEHEIPKGKQGLTICKICRATYYKKSWRHNLGGYKNFREDLPVYFIVCPACQMIKNRQFEGRIIIENIPIKILGGLKHLTETFCKRAYLRDSQHRLIDVKKTKTGLEITVTENQLAVKLAKKIKDTFKKVDAKISYSPAPSDVVYIVMKFV